MWVTYTAVYLEEHK